MRNDFRERVGEAIIITPNASDYKTLIARNAVRAMYEPDPHAVAKAADQLGMDATKVAAIWMIMIEEMGK